MALILNLETATTVCSVSLGINGELIALKEINGDYSHAENLTVFIEEVMKQSGKKLMDIDAVAVSKGPGSYTGLRIGVSAAKGLCYSLAKPLIAIDTLRYMAYALSQTQHQEPDPSSQNKLYCPMIDARRMEVYCGLYDRDNVEIKPVSAEIIDENSFAEWLGKNRIVFFGDGSAKCKTILSHQTNSIFVDDITPSAKNMIPLSEKAFARSQFEDVAYFEPFYLKDFVAGKKKEKQ